MNNPKPKTTIVALYRYPIQFCSGIAISRAGINQHGLCGDYEFSIVDHNGDKLTYANAPRLTDIRVNMIWNAINNKLWSGMTIAISCSNLPTVYVPYYIPEPARSEYRHSKIRTVNGVMEALDMDNQSRDSKPSIILSKFLNMNCRLVRLPQSVPRGLRVISESTLVTDHQSSVANAHLIKFQPNLVINNCTTHAEETWQSFRLGDFTCQRKDGIFDCKSPTPPISHEIALGQAIIF